MSEPIRPDRIQDAMDLLHRHGDVTPDAVAVIVKAVGLTPAERERMGEIADLATRWHSWRADVANARADALEAQRVDQGADSLALTGRQSEALAAPNRRQRRTAAARKRTAA